MKIFISYAHAQRPMAEEINASLAAHGLDVFFDRADLRTGEEYDRRIRDAIEESDLFVFLVSPESVRPGGYTATELAIRRRSHPNPSGSVLPVMVKATLLKRLDPYLRAVTILYPQGNLAADVAAAVADLGVGRSSPRAEAALGTPNRCDGLLQGERIESYKALWQLTRLLPKWPRNREARYEDLSELSARFRDWYFASGGGLFLSRDAHSAYAAVQNALAAVLEEKLAGPLTDEHYDSIRELCSNLRTRLASDVGARE